MTLETTCNEGYIPLSGGKVWYKICGSSEKKAPLVVVHGVPGFSHDYLETLEELSNERPVIFYDQHCCGNSEKTDDSTNWTIDYLGFELQRVVEMAMKTLGSNNYHLFAHSFGASIVVSQILHTKLDGLVSIVLASPNLSITRLRDDLNRCISLLPQSVRDVLKSETPPGKFDEAPIAFYKSFFCRSNPWPDCLNRTLGKINESMFDYMFGPGLFHITGTLREFDVTGRLGEIPFPTLLTGGLYDEITPETIQYYHGKIRNSEMAIFNESAHMAHLEQKDEYMNYIRNFISKHDVHL